MSVLFSELWSKRERAYALTRDLWCRVTTNRLPTATSARQENTSRTLVTHSVTAVVPGDTVLEADDRRTHIVSEVVASTFKT